MTDAEVVTLPVIGRIASWARHLVDMHHIHVDTAKPLTSGQARDYHTYLHTNAKRHGRRHTHHGGV